MQTAMQTFLNALDVMLGNVGDFLFVLGGALYDFGGNLSGPVYELPAILWPIQVAQNAGANSEVIAAMNSMLLQQDSATVIVSVTNPIVSELGAMTQEIGQILTSMPDVLSSFIDWLYTITDIDVVTSTFLGAL